MTTSGSYDFTTTRDNLITGALRLCGDKAWTFECGWLLDNYMKDREATIKHPRAVFQFQPQIRTVKKET